MHFTRSRYQRAATSWIDDPTPKKNCLQFESSDDSFPMHDPLAKVLCSSWSYTPIPDLPPLPSIGVLILLVIKTFPLISLPPCHHPSINPKVWMNLHLVRLIFHILHEGSRSGVSRTAYKLKFSQGFRASQNEYAAYCEEYARFKN